ncbi:SAM-dependent methyltransferase [Virgibacillus flavescens]|uniref:SAM-dependent methyltransferase n=1 Tax=Virgibacillus flavescens TaxID=1611422 RepID=UPI003D35401E
MKEYYFDKLLNINTGGSQNESHTSFHYFPYEPTQYSALEILFNEYELKSSDRVVDFGSGKGRLNFYIHYFYQASVAGIEMNETFYQIAIQNKTSYNKKKKDKIEFHCCLAEEYKIKPDDNRFYFFNPFSKEIFINVINKILRSVEQEARQIDLILYYPSDDYIYFLENNTSFELEKEIKLPDADCDPFERFLIYRYE